MFQLGGALDQALPLGDDLPLMCLALLGEVTADAVHRIVDMQIEPRTESGAFYIVASVLQGCGP